MTHSTLRKSRTKLALGATIVLAAAPVSVFAQVAPDAALPSAPAAAPAAVAPAATAPVVVIPQVAPAPAPVAAPVASVPVVQPVATVAPTVAAPDTAAATPRSAAKPPKATAPRVSAARQAETAVPAVASASAVPAAVASAPVSAALPATTPAPVNAVPAAQIDGAPPVVAASTSSGGDNGVPLGLLGALGLTAVAGAGVFALRRRRTHNDGAEHIYAAPTEPVDLTPEPITPTEARPLDLAAPAVASIPAAAVSRPGARDLLLQGEPAPTGEARQELLDRMVAAEPDEANPFRSAQARRKRARLILQSHDARATGQAAERETDPAFDWRKWQGSGQNGGASTLTPARIPEPVS